MQHTLSDEKCTQRLIRKTWREETIWKTKR